MNPLHSSASGVLRNCLRCFLVLICLYSSLARADVWSVSSSATATEMRQACRTAGKVLQDELGARTPKLILVFDTLGASTADRQKMLDTLGGQFDKNMLFGCTGRDAVFAGDNAGATLALLALGGDITVVSANADVKNGQWVAAGKQLADALKPAYDTAAHAPGRVVLLYTQSTSPQLTAGMQDALGKDAPIVGGGTQGSVYARGVAGNASTAILLSGDFTCGIGLTVADPPPGKTLEQAQIPASVIQSASDAAELAAGDNPEDVLALIVCDCISRREYALSVGAEAELKALKSVTGAPMAGCFGEAEIGQPAGGISTIAQFHIATCALRSTKPLVKAAIPKRQVAVVMDPASPRAKLLEQLQLSTTPCPDVLQAIAAGKYGVIIADATPALLHTLADAKDKVSAYVAKGNYLLLWGLTPDGLADFNRLTGMSHLLRPFAMEELHLPSSPDPLLNGLDPFNVIMTGSKRGMLGYPLRADDVWSYVLDGDDIAPFSTFPPSVYWRPTEKDFAAPGNDHYAPNLVNGFDDSWITGFTFPTDKPEYLKWTFTFPRAEVVTGFTITPDNLYRRIAKVRLSFVDSTTPPMDLMLQTELIPQDFPIPNIRASGLTVEILEMTGKATVTGIRNIWIHVQRPADFSTKMKSLLSLGVLNCYPQGAGGIIVDQMQVNEATLTEENRSKEKAILGTLLHNLGAKHAGQGGPRVTADWPQWRGPNRDSVSPETGLALEWGVTPPKPLWQVNVGLGYSSMAVAAGKLYTEGWNWRNGNNTVACLDAVTGKAIWKYGYPAGSGVWLDVGRGHIPDFMGARATPAIDGNRVYTLGTDGQAFCFAADSGKILWQRRLAKEKDANINGDWWLSASPLVVGNKVILGSKGGGIAVDKLTGKTLWSVGNETAGLSSPSLFQRQGKLCLQLRSSSTIYTVDPDTGKIIWTYTWWNGSDSADPLVIGDNLLMGGAYSRGSSCIPIGSTTPLWKGNTVIPEVSSPILYKGLIYCETGYGEGPIACINPVDGTHKFTTTGTLNFVNHLIVDGKLIAMAYNGVTNVYDILPDRFKFLGSYTPPGKQVSDTWWTQPIIAQGRLYLRSWRGDLLALDVSGDDTIIPHKLKPTLTSQGPRYAEWRSPLDKSSPPPFQAPTATDWSQWRGAKRDGIATDFGVKLNWSARAPSVRWRLDIGYGDASIVGAGDRIYTSGYRYSGDGQEYVWCVDARNSRVIWKYEYAPHETGVFLDADRGKSPQGMGPRATPLLDGDKVYAFNTTGDVFCLDAGSGNLIWTKNVERDLPEDNNVKRPVWFHGGAPAIVGDALILNAGLAGVALNKKTGAFLWGKGAAAGGQANPVLFPQDGKPRLAVLGATALNIVDPADGKIQWSLPWTKADYPVIPDPLVLGDKLLITNNTGGTLTPLGADKPTWTCTALQPKVGTPIFYQGYLYSANQPDGELVCVNATDGIVKWRTKLPVTQLLLAGDTLVLQGQHGDITLAAASPDGYKPLGTAKLLDSDECWIAPAIINGRLFCRSWEGELVCVDLKDR